MRLKHLFVANSIISLPFGIGSVLVPHLFLSLFGASLGPAGAFMMQYAGAWLIGIGLLTWFARNATGSEAGRAVAQALLVAYLMALIVSVLSQVAGVLNVLGWMPVAIQTFFGLGLGYSLMVEREAVAAAAGSA
jgi:hypothetical protein